MSTEENKTFVRRIWEEAGSQGNFGIIDEAIAPNFLYHTSALPEYHGPEGFKRFFGEHRSGVPDLHYTLYDLLAEGDQVAVRWTASGIQTGTLMGVPPTGKQVTVPGISIFRIAHGKIEEGQTVWDALGALQQLGVIPTGQPS